MEVVTRWCWRSVAHGSHLRRPIPETRLLFRAGRGTNIYIQRGISSDEIVEQAERLKTALVPTTRSVRSALPASGRNDSLTVSPPPARAIGTNKFYFPAFRYVFTGRPNCITGPEYLRPSSRGDRGRPPGTSGLHPPRRKNAPGARAIKQTSGAETGTVVVVNCDGVGGCDACWDALFGSGGFGGEGNNTKFA